MNTKTMISGVLGGITYFLLGWLMYGILFKDMMAGCSGTATGVMKADTEMVMWALVIGNLALGMAMAYILGTWSGVTTFGGGAKAAAMVGFLLSLGYDLSWYSMTNVFTLQGIAMDVLIFTVMSAVAGGIIGWWLGRSNT